MGDGVHQIDAHGAEVDKGAEGAIWTAAAKDFLGEVHDIPGTILHLVSNPFCFSR